MIAALTCLVAAVACQRVEPVTAPPRMPPAVHAVAGPAVTLSFTCTLVRSSSTMSCAPATKRGAPGERDSRSTWSLRAIRCVQSGRGHR